MNKRHKIQFDNATRHRVIHPGRYAVANMRKSDKKALDYYPTPPWATRAFVRHVLGRLGMGIAAADVWEPACGEAHMSSVLRYDFGARVFSSDVFDYGQGQDAVGSFVGDGLDVIEPPHVFDWIITNPPFKLASEFAQRALSLSPRSGVAFLVRSNWLEGVSRYRDLFEPSPPAIVAQYVERVPMTEGRWDPDATTATAYCWIVWLTGAHKRNDTSFIWIPPGQREALSMPGDRDRFADFSTIKGEADHGS